MELERSYPAVSASVTLTPREGSDAICETGTDGDVTYAIRGFDSPEYRFPTYGICAMRPVYRTVLEGRERALWAITVRTNHDTAAYRRQAIARAIALAKPGEAILVAGKGHEDYQIIGDKVLSFDDCKVAAEELEKVFA